MNEVKLPPLPKLPPHEVEEWSESYITFRGAGWLQETVEKYAQAYARAAIEANTHTGTTEMNLDIQAEINLKIDKMFRLLKDEADKTGRELERPDLHKYEIDRLSGKVNGLMLAFTLIQKGAQ